MRRGYRLRPKNFCERLSAFLLLLVLPACGFSPIYGTTGAGGTDVARALNRVEIENIADRDGQILRNHLMDRLYGNGRPAQPEARLAVNIKSAETSLGVQKDATTSRSELVLWADYILSGMNGKKLMSGKARAVVSYGNLSAQYGNLESRDHARDRALREVGEQIVNHLGLYYAQRDAANAAGAKALP